MEKFVPLITKALENGLTCTTDPKAKYGRANTLGQAVRSIKNHDKWQLKGRPGEKRTKDFILQVQ